MSEIARLRASVMKAHKNAGSKVSRIEKDGVSLRGSSFDPRVDVSKVAGYNSRQLKAYAARLESFNSRNTQFVGGYGGAPIPRHEWRRYKNREALFNRQADAVAEKFGHVTIPGTGGTVNERLESLTPKGRRRVRSGEYSPFGRVERKDASGVMGVEGLRKLSENLKTRSSSADRLQRIQTQRFAAYEMADAMGDAKLKKAMQGLDNDQFDLLWNNTSFANDMAAKYSVKTKPVSRTGSVEFSDEDDTSELSDMISWASSVTPAAKTVKTPRKPRVKKK